MKLLSVLLSIAGVSGLVWVCPVGAETGGLASLGDKETGRRGESSSREIPQSPSYEVCSTGGTPATQLRANPPVPQSSSVDLLAQGITRVTGVEIIQTAEGFELVLETVAGSERLVPLIVPEGNDLVIDILDATLAFSIRNGVTEVNPAPGIRRVTVNRAEEDSIQVRISGENQTPNAEVLAGRDDLVLSIVPERTTTEQEADEEIEVIATGQGEDDDYSVDNASTATKTDTPLRDVPQSIQVVPQQVIEDRNVRDVFEATETVSGVTRGTNFEGSSAGSRIIRGFVQEGNFRNGYRDASNRFIISSPINAIEQIEILKGPASVLFGNLEPGGIVNVVTKKPLSEPFYELEFEAGNRNFYQPGVDLSGPLTTDKDLLYRFAAAYRTKDEPQDFGNTDEVSVAPSLTWKIGERTNLDLYYEYSDFSGQPLRTASVQLSDGSLTPRELYVGYPDFNDYDINVQRFGYTLTHEFNDNWQIRNNFSGLFADTTSQRTQTFELEQERFITTRIVDRESDYDNYFVQLDVVGEFKTGSVDHQLVVGFDFNDFTDDFRSLIDLEVPRLDLQNPNYDILEPEFEPQIAFTNDVQSYGAYLQDLIAFGDKFKLLVGGRYDWNTSVFEIADFGPSGNTTEEPEITEGAFSPRVGLVYQPTETVALFASFSRSFSQDRFISSSTAPSEPTRGTQYEIGVKTDFLDQRLSTTLAAYHLTKTNVVTTDPDDPDFSIQTGEQRSQGIELDVNGEILPGWNITAAYAYTDAEITEDNTLTVGNRLNNVPENQASIWTTYELQTGSLSGLGFGLGLFYVGEREGDLDNTFQVDDYLRTDAALYYNRGRLKTAVNFRNLFDTDYVQFADGARTLSERGDPFTVIGSVSYEF